MRVALVNLTSSGHYLTNALAERGVSIIHVHQPELRRYCGTGRFPTQIDIPHESFTDTTQALKKLDVVAVVAGGERGVTLSEELAAALGLPHNRLALARARRDKFAMARTLERQGIPIARTEKVSAASELDSALRRIGRFPVVVKPVGSAASDGVTVCGTEAKVREAVASLGVARNFMEQENTSVLLQEYLDGPQYSVDVVSRHGHHIVCAVAVTRFDNVDGFPLWRSRQVLRELTTRDAEVVGYTLRCLDGLGVTDSASNNEVRLTTAGPRLVEVNARLGGPTLAPDPYVKALGFSPATLLADSILDYGSFRARVGKPYRAGKSMAAIALQPPGEGVIRAMPGLDAIRRLPTFHSLEKLPPSGSTVGNRRLNLAGGGIAHFIGDDPDAVAADVARVHRMEDESRLFTMDVIC